MNIYKVDYSVGFENRTKIPRHALAIKWKETSKVKCFAFFKKVKGKPDQPVNATLVPKNKLHPISRYNYKVQILN